MKYIKITNQAEEVNRLKLEKLGFSTKRDDEQTIGQFGSGIKFAPISAMRKGIDFVFAGADHKGSYTLRYIIKDDEGVPSVFYKYDDYEKPSSFTSEAGTLSWESEFQIYREVVANAMDEARISDTEWNIDIVDVDEIHPVDGEFSVYLGVTDELLEVHNNFDKYFSVNREPIFEPNSRSRIYDSIDGTLRVYCKGVLVYSAQHRVNKNGGDPIGGLFDYEFDNLKLNEERTIQSEWDMNREIVNILAKIEDEELIEKLMKLFLFEDDSHEEYYETVNIPAYMYNVNTSSGWKEYFDANYPKHVLVNLDYNSINLGASIHSKGYSSIVIDHNAIEMFLKSAGIPTFQDIFGEAFIYDYEMGFDSNINLQRAVKIVTAVYPEFKEFHNRIGIVKDIEEDKAILGMTVAIKLDLDSDDLTKVILISNDHVNGSSVQELIATLIHEWDHLKSGIGDGDIEGRMFRELADTRIGNLVFDIWSFKALA